MLILVACQQQGPIDLDAYVEKARMGDAEASRQLVEMLGVDKNRLGEKVYPMIVDIGKPMIDALLTSVQTDNRAQRERIIAALGTLRVEKAVQPISAVLRNKELKRRYVAAWALGEIRQEDAIEHLLHALGDPEAVVRHYATGALIKFNRSAVEPLIAFIPAAGHVAAGAAIRALGDIGDKRSLDVLLNQVEGPNRKDAILALGKLRDARAEKALIDGLNDEDWEVRMNAAMALGPIGTQRSVAVLEKALNDEIMVVREWSARSLSVIQGTTVFYRDAHGEMVEPYSVYH